MQQPPHAAFCSRCGSALVPTSAVPRRTPIEPSVAWVLLIVFGVRRLLKGQRAKRAMQAVEDTQKEKHEAELKKLRERLDSIDTLCGYLKY